MHSMMYLLLSVPMTLFTLKVKDSITDEINGAPFVESYNVFFNSKDTKSDEVNDAAIDESSDAIFPFHSMSIGCIISSGVASLPCP